MSTELPKKRGRKPKKVNNLEMKIDTVVPTDNTIQEPKKERQKT